MPTTFIGAKHTVFDIYPLTNKRVLVLVDPQNLGAQTTDNNCTFGTLDYLLKRRARVMVAASFGDIAGVPLNLSKKQREAATDAFRRESGMGFTNFFALLSVSKKMEVLRNVPDFSEKHAPHGASSTTVAELARGETPPTGKTTFFGLLSNQQKARALHKVFPRKPFLPSSTAPIVDVLASHFPDTRVHFAPDCLRAPLDQLQPGEIMVLENLRFYRNEALGTDEERLSMAEVLAAYIDIFINDSFATTHLRLASNMGLPKILLHAAAGQSLDREIAFYSKFLLHPARPVAIVVGGGDIPNKLRLIHNMINKVDRIVVAGAVVYPFLVAQGFSCGSGYEVGDKETMVSRIDYTNRLAASDESGAAKRQQQQQRRQSSAVNGAAGRASSRRGTAAPELNGGSKANGSSGGGGGAAYEGKEARSSYEWVKCSEFAKEIITLCQEARVDLVLPIDHVVALDPNGDKSLAVIVDSPAIPNGVYAVDVGVNTVSFFLRSLRRCHTVFWTGTLGWVSKGYKSGTTLFANSLAELTDVKTIVGGRYTARLVQENGLTANLMHVSSGGMASLEVLQGNSMPGLEMLSDVAPHSEARPTASVGELVRRLPLFAGCTSHQLKLVTKKFTRRVHAKGDYLVLRGSRHTRLYLVSQGALVVRYGEDYKSLPARYLTKGHSVGMYDFIAQSFALETVRVAQNDTVTYQLSSTAFDELLSAQPDLAAQLLQNVSEPLRLISSEYYERQQQVLAVTERNGCRARVPLITGAMPNALTGFWPDTLQDILSTVAFQKLSMQFLPYVSTTDYMDPDEFFFNTIHRSKPSTRQAFLSRMRKHRGLGYSLGVVVVRNLVYHRLVALFKNPWVAAACGAVAAAPLRLLSYGICYSDINFKFILDEALISVAASLAPLVTYAAAAFAQKKIESHRQRRTPRAAQLLLMTAIKLLLGFGVFPIIYQRNYLYAQPTASRFWSRDAFRAYESKQVLQLLMRFSLQTTYKKLFVSTPLD